MAQAPNIKNRVNRQSVERALKMFKSNMKLVAKIPDNGIIYCFGIDEFDQEIFEGIVPPNPVDRFYYKCDRLFHLEQYDKMFEKKSSGHVVFIDGTECIVYKYDGLWTRMKYFDALLVKRQSKGGQSSVRFARLAEESRDHYITHVVDTLNEVITDNKSINYVFGGDELKKMLLTRTDLKAKFKTESAYHTFNRETIYEPYFVALMNTVNNDDINKIAQQIVTYIEVEPEYLLFSPTEIAMQKDNVEYVLIISEKLSEFELGDKKIYKLNIDNLLYGRLNGFQIIGKLYYKPDESYDLAEIENDKNIDNPM